jgi:lyso-ornithine lipid O-acyltransferase
MNLRGRIKFIAFTVIVSFFLLLTLPFYPLQEKYPYKTKKCLAWLLHFFAKILRKILNLKVHFEEPSRGKRQLKGEMIVANHLSYLDIICISSLYPVCFVTSVEVKNSFFLGHLAKLSGCLFVERRKRSGLDKEIGEISEVLKHGINVCVFPEATSTNGETVQSFKRPLFKASILSNKRVTPLTLNYLKINEERVTADNRDQLFWYGTMTFLAHLKDVLSLKKIVVRMEMDFSLWHPDYQELAELSHSRVKNHYIAPAASIL